MFNNCIDRKTVYFDGIKSELSSFAKKAIEFIKYYLHGSYTRSHVRVIRSFPRKQRHVASHRKEKGPIQLTRTYFILRQLNLDM